MTPPSWYDDVLKRLERLERKVDELVRLVRTDLYGEGSPPEKRERVRSDGRREQFLPGTGWVVDLPPARKRK